MNASHSREQLSRQMSSPNQEVRNFPNDIESAVNGTSKRTEGGRHVVTMHQTEKYVFLISYSLL